jgi:methionine synthase II (cobalamin-independent)
MAVHRAEVARRLSAPAVVQFDEPLLAAALAGRISGVTAFSPVHPVDETVAIGLLDELVATVGAEVMLHSCAANLSWKVVQRSAIHAVSVDVATLGADALDGLAGFVDSGRTVVLGLVPAITPDRGSSAEEMAAEAAGVTDRIGFPRSVLAGRIGLSPTCGLAGATAAWARAATELTQRAARLIADGSPATQTRFA